MKELSKKQLLEENRALKTALENATELINKLTNEVEKLLEENKKLKQENALLREKVNVLVRKVFGPSSEKMDPAQLDLLILQPENMPRKIEASSLAGSEEASPTKRKTDTRGRPRYPDNLPVIEEVIDPAEVKESPDQWRCIGEEISEQLDYDPARFYRRRFVRRKYVSRQDVLAAPVIAPLPEMLQARCSLSPSLMAEIIMLRYGYHMPFYRQEQMFWNRHEIWLPRQHMVRWTELCADWLRLVYEEIHRQIMSGGYVQIDETVIKYLEPGHGSTKTGYFWTASRPGGDVYFRWETSRSAACLNNIVPVDFRGTIQCDGYASYPAFTRNKNDIELAACWAHARRTFFEARELDPKRARWVLRLIGKLYAIEEKLRNNKSDPPTRAEIRNRDSRPIYNRIHRLLTQWKIKSQFFPSSGMGKAIDYTLNLWPELGKFLDDGRIEIDQNIVENSIRPTAVGKRYAEVVIMRS